MVMDCNVTSDLQDVEVEWEAPWKLPVQLAVTFKATCSWEGGQFAAMHNSLQTGASCTEFIKPKFPRMAVEAGPE